MAILGCIWCVFVIFTALKYRYKLAERFPDTLVFIGTELWLLGNFIFVLCMAVKYIK